MFQDKMKSSRRRMRNRLLAIARTWIGTPYQHQAMLKQVGVDCVGFIVGVGLEAGVLALTKNEISAYSGYGRLPNPKQMLRVMKKYLIEVSVDDKEIGDLVWIQWRAGLPMHLAFIGKHNETPTLIHALGDIEKVTEHRLTAEWEQRIVSYWRYPGLT